MRVTATMFALAIAISMSVALSGCGGNVSTARTTTANPAPPAPAAPPPLTPLAPTTPPPAPPVAMPPVFTPPPGTSGTTQWQVVLHGLNGNNGGLSGTATVTTNGDVTLQFTGATPSTTFTLQFCPFTLTSNSAPCVSAPMVLSDGSGTGQVSFHFAQSGTWAGFFLARTSSASVPVFGSLAETAGAYSSAVQQIEPATAANGIGIDGTHAQDPGGGSLSVTSGTAHVVLTGAQANHSYRLFSCFSGSSSCQSAGNFNTDASGNATVDMKLVSNGVGIVAIADSMQTTFVMFAGGFKVP